VPASQDWAGLERLLAGELLRPGSEAFERARRPFIARFDEIAPRAVVRCAAPADVAEALAFAGRFGLEVAVRSGGHDLAGRSSTRGVLLDLTPLDFAEVAGDTVRVGAGARTGALCELLHQHGLAIPTGTCPSVGIAGLALGGGPGILRRAHGLTCDRLLAAEVVLADGRTVTCDSGRHPDLFWALRGAGAGSFGVVTAFRFAALPAPGLTTSFHLVWPCEQAPAVIAAWQRWAPAGPGELAADLALSADADPAGQPTIEAFGALLAGGAQAEPLLAELNAIVGSDPRSIGYRELSYLDTCRFQAELSVTYDLIERTGQGERRRQGYRFTASEFFARPLPSQAIAALLDTFAAPPLGGHSRAIYFAPWGGAHNRMAADATAFAHRDQLLLIEHEASADPTAATPQKRAARDWTRHSRDSVHARGSGRVYPAFPDPDLPDWERAYHGNHRWQLREIKSDYDPHNRFRGTQTIPLP
jgi:FAD/FMN-containing dehydrogenase